ncbi:MAG: aminopeptidase P family protein [Pseudomonadota bacterium]
MFQTFTSTTRPETCAPRVAALRAAMAEAGVDAFLVPRADAHQGETVAPRDARLQWIASFTGSAGFAAITATRAALFVDGRYTLQAATQSDTTVFEMRNIPGDALSDWLLGALPEGGTVAYDPWLHTPAEIERLQSAGLALAPIANLIDGIWADQPIAPSAPVIDHPESLAGVSRDARRARIAEALTAREATAAVLTQPDAIAWLLNIRGSDIARMPVALGFAIIEASGSVRLYGFDGKIDAAMAAALGPDVSLGEDLLADVAALTGNVCLARETVPMAIASALTATPDWHDPIALPKACKTPEELAGTRAAHIRDGAAMVRFLHWLDETAPTGTLTEIDVVTALEAERRRDPTLRDISFETICGAGPNGAIVHYRVTSETNRAVSPGELLLVDSGGQYADGTTDITRTLLVGDGPVPEGAAEAFTRVLQGMIAISTARWPKGLAGRDLDPLARAALWRAGQDYAHGTGHGVGAYLGVHEGPQRISRVSHVPLEPGMILSNEPGYYREGAFGIRIENLVIVEAPRTPEGGDHPMHGFETITLAPIDRRLVVTSLLTNEERDWLNAYHARVLDTLTPHLERAPLDWLKAACQPL